MIENQKFGKLTIIEIIEPKYRKDGSKITMVLCKCDCGNITNKRFDKIKSGRTKSCGCTKKLNEHGHSKKGKVSPTYSSWRSMKDRCVYRNNQNYKEKGVIICETWLTYTNFLEDMGERPKGKTLDRIDPDGNYEPENCRWATPKEQRLNQRNKLITCNICGYQIKNGYYFNLEQHIKYKHPQQ